MLRGVSYQVGIVSILARPEGRALQAATRKPLNVLKKIMEHIIGISFLLGSATNYAQVIVFPHFMEHIIGAYHALSISSAYHAYHRSLNQDILPCNPLLTQAYHGAYHRISSSKHIIPLSIREGRGEELSPLKTRTRRRACASLFGYATALSERKKKQLGIFRRANSRTD